MCEHRMNLLFFLLLSSSNFGKPLLTFIFVHRLTETKKTGDMLIEDDLGIIAKKKKASVSELESRIYNPLITSWEYPKS